jgi:hypothetical protein
MRMAMRIAGALGAAAVVGTAVPAVAAVPQAALIYHGYVTLADGRADVSLTPRNVGATPVAGASVRLHWSRALAGNQELPKGCAVTDPSTVECGTGPLVVGGVGRGIRLRVGLAGTPSEVRLEIDTLWNSGGLDRTPGEDRQQVLVLDTGDTYTF